MMEPLRTSPISYKTTVIMMNMTVNVFATAMRSNVNMEWGNLDAGLTLDTIICHINLYPLYMLPSRTDDEIRIYI